MSPCQVVALGPGLLPFAREYTDDLNEAQFLVHRVVLRLVNATRAERENCETADVIALMMAVAQTDGIAGRTVS